MPIIAQQLQIGTDVRFGAAGAELLRAGTHGAAPMITLLLKLLLLYAAYTAVDFLFYNDLDALNYAMAKLSFYAVGSGLLPHFLTMAPREGADFDHTSLGAAAAAELAKVRSMYNMQGSLSPNTATRVQRITTLTAEGNVTVRLYIPFGIKEGGDDLRPIVFWLHGGGWVLGGLGADNLKCMGIANSTRALVVSVDYRLAPENPFPAPVVDVIAAFHWMLAFDMTRYGGDVDRVVVAGESAGGTLAAALASSHYSSPAPRRNIVGLVLIYPPLVHGVHMDSHFRYRSTNGMLTLYQMLWFWKLYLPDPAVCLTDRLACPLNTPREVLAAFPATLVMQAKHDVLLDEGVALHQKLLAAGACSELKIFNRSVHGFFSNPAGSDSAEAMQLLAGHVRRVGYGGQCAA